MDQSSSKSIFESLAIMIENEKPKFRLNEPAFSAGNVPLSSNSESDDDDSFIVLGKTSMDCINNASMIEYNEIQEKSAAVDYNSIISTLNNEEIESKIREILQENVKLKETLAQNNKAMKSQFNKLISWQKELMKVHEVHKKKFAETRDMITLLQRENTELKTKLANINSMEEQKFSGEIVRINGLPTRKPYIYDSVSYRTPSIFADITIPNSMENSDDMKNFSVKKMKELSDLVERQECDLHYQEEIISSLKVQLQVSTENCIKPFVLSKKNTVDAHNDKNRQRFLDNFMHYNEKLSAVVKCYADQAFRFLSVQDCLKRCIDVLKAIDINSETKIKESTYILENCRKQLINEQIDDITERQNLIMAQNQFQKIFSDYNSAVNELEILHEENKKPTEEKNSIQQQREELLQTMKIIDEEKNQLNTVKEQLIAERTIFEQQQAGLEEAKASLNSHSLIYETKIKNLQDSIKIMKTRYYEILNLCTKYEDEIEENKIKFAVINAQLESVKDEADMAVILRQQLDLYKTDFEDEKNSKQQLIFERELLTDELRKLRDHNQELLYRLNGSNPLPIHQEMTDESMNNLFCNICGAYKMTGQWHGFGLCQTVD